jgi:hypothetical protein
LFINELRGNIYLIKAGELNKSEFLEKCHFREWGINNLDSYESERNRLTIIFNIKNFKVALCIKILHLNGKNRSFLCQGPGEKFKTTK